MNVTGFKSWLKEEQNIDEVALSSSKARTPTDKLGRAELSKEIVKEGDIVEIGKKTQHMGHPAAKLGKVVHVDGSQVTVEPFVGDKMQLIPIDNLLLVEPSPEQRSELNRIGANNYWKFRTKKQIPSEERSLAKQAKERAEAESKKPREVSDGDVRSLKMKLFGGQFFNPSKPKDVQAGSGPDLFRQLGIADEAPPAPKQSFADRPGPLANYKNKIGRMNF